MNGRVLDERCDGIDSVVSRELMRLAGRLLDAADGDENTAIRRLMRRERDLREREARDIVRNVLEERA